ncbi:unnamed protein product [Eruca vesicaria subsp. sativa]|uniref:Uncharacterized protein n=1 Tax=Eruca vesicaria subsp. sativa TaxID=29727 RepID=A0ABC8M3T8_ERUVS|nr:unnamed protein product [Eruca vesicaria subsp. sativa]
MKLLISSSPVRDTESGNEEKDGDAISSPFSLTDITFFFSIDCNLKGRSSIRRTKLQIPSNVLVFRRGHKNLNWVQLQTNQRFVRKSLGDDSSTPAEET